MNNSPQRIHPDFKPSVRVFELAETQGIPIDYVKKQVPEFIFYFQEKGIRRDGWDRSYWAWIKRGWERKEEKRKKQTRTNPQANVEWQPEKIEIAKTRPSLKTLRRIAAGVKP